MMRRVPRTICLLLISAVAVTMISGGCMPALSVTVGREPTPPPALPGTTTIARSTAEGGIVLVVTPTPTVTPTLTPPPPTPTAPPPPPQQLTRTQRQQMFDEVWSKVNTYYLYPDFHGLDWEDVRTEFAPRIATAHNPDEFYALLTEMVERLGDQHSRFLAPGAAIAEDERIIGVENRVGIGIITAFTEKGLIIQRVFPGSQAEQAGLQPHDRIIAVDGTPCTPRLCGRIQGPEGTQVELTIAKVHGEIVNLTVTRQPVSVRQSPTTYRLTDDIGYISIPSLWINDMAQQVSGALTDMVVERPLRGLVIDLRGNPGGWRSVMVSVLSHFVRGDVGTFFNRNGKTPLIVKEGSGPDLRGLPLVVLVDKDTASYAEVLAGVLRLEAGAFIIGQPTFGNTETIYAYELEGGARLWLAQEGFFLSNGINLEGQGVQPDRVMDADWMHYAELDDPYVQEALLVLNSK